MAANSKNDLFFGTGLATLTAVDEAGASLAGFDPVDLDLVSNITIGASADLVETVGGPSRLAVGSRAGRTDSSVSLTVNQCPPQLEALMLGAPLVTEAAASASVEVRDSDNAVVTDKLSASLQAGIPAAFSVARVVFTSSTEATVSFISTGEGGLDPVTITLPASGASQTTANVPNTPLILVQGSSANAAGDVLTVIVNPGHNGKDTVTWDGVTQAPLCRLVVATEDASAPYSQKIVTVYLVRFQFPGLNFNDKESVAGVEITGKYLKPRNGTKPFDIETLVATR